MNRRNMLKLSAGATCTFLGSVLPAVSSAAPKRQDVERWDVFEASFEGPGSGNPFIDVALEAIFTIGHRSVTVSGFYDGASIYRVRFMPDEPGRWSYRTSSRTVTLDGHTGEFTCVPASDKNRGPVSVRDTHHFGYADGSRYYPFGTTCYAWVHQSDEVQQQTLRTLASSPFNKLRMLVFPKSYEYNRKEPERYPFARNADGVSDFTQINPAFFQHIESRIGDLRNLGIEADVILFHPYDRWGYASMPPEADDRYLRYVIARFAAYRNVWWSLANEYDLMRAKSTVDWDRFARIVQQEDPYSHLRSIHFSKAMYDYSRDWVTHASLQTTHFEKGAEWRAEWAKPVIYDECQYEGNIPSRWGNLSGQEMAYRFWLGAVAGCYVTHGETYLSKDDIIWWSHGGELHGTSPARIAFLRKLVEASKGGLDPLNSYYLSAEHTERRNRNVPPDYLLYYFDEHQPGEYEFPLPTEATYRAELIDPWTMQITLLKDECKGVTKLTLPSEPHRAVRFMRM